MHDISNIKCGNCEVALEPVAEPNPQDRFICPKCGDSDTRKNILRIAGESVTDQTAHAFDRSMRNATRGNKSLKYKSTLRHKRRHRFIVDLDLR
jgi:hypothetical protein